MQVTKRQEANYRERGRERDEAQVNPGVGVGTKDWHVHQVRMEMAGVWVF